MDPEQLRTSRMIDLLFKSFSNLPPRDITRAGDSVTINVTPLFIGGSGKLAEFVGMLGHTHLDEYSIHQRGGNVSLEFIGQNSLELLANAGVKFDGCEAFLAKGRKF